MFLSLSEKKERENESAVLPTAQGASLFQADSRDATSLSHGVSMMASCLHGPYSISIQIYSLATVNFESAVLETVQTHSYV
jgi:hypothetical protein